MTVIRVPGIIRRWQQAHHRHAPFKPVSVCYWLTAIFIFAGSLQAQEASNEQVIAEPVIAVSPDATADEDIERRIRAIYSQIRVLSDVVVTVNEGVVFLSGSVANDIQARRALDLALRLQGVVTVDDGIERSLDVHGNVTPLVEQFQANLGRWIRASPLFLLALSLLLLIAFLGHQLAKWSSLWNRISPNPFLGELMAQAVRIVAILTGLILALNLLGATALIGTILGGAGVLGLAIGFAVRDSLENYISSIMLSLRQPFRASDHVVIDSHEGKVVRLTSRATVLMTLDGNHLRIPNSTVFKAVILNYTSNPERRFEFELGVDAEDDPVAAMSAGLDAIRELPFVLDDPEPSAIISLVGDSNIVLRFMGWVNQESADFAKSRSLAIRAAMTVLEAEGFTLPEPIYRLRFDPRNLPVSVAADGVSQPSSELTSVTPRRTQQKNETVAELRESLDVTPDRHLEDKVSEERAIHVENDLLDQDRPVE